MFPSPDKEIYFPIFNAESELFLLQFKVILAF